MECEATAPDVSEGWGLVDRISAGGGMAFQLAIEAPDLVAAIAPVVPLPYQPSGGWLLHCHARPGYDRISNRHGRRHQRRVHILHAWQLRRVSSTLKSSIGASGEAGVGLVRIAVDDVRRWRKNGSARSVTGAPCSANSQYFSKTGFRRSINEPSPVRLTRPLRDVIRVLPHWPKDRNIELAPKYWAATRLRLDATQLEAEVGPLTVPPKLPPSTEQQSSPS